MPQTPLLDQLGRSPHGVLLVDPRGRIAFANDLALSLLGDRDLVGRSVEELVPEPLREAHRGHRARPTLGPHLMGAGRQVMARHAQGHTVPVEIRLSPVEVEGERYTLCALQDASARQALQQRVDRARQRAFQAEQNDSLALLAGGVAHDFKNLLTVVLCGVEEALERCQDPDAIAALRDALRAGHHATQLAHQLLDYAGRRPTALQETDLSGLVRGMEEVLRSALPGRVRLHLALEELPSAQADPTQLQQVLLNLALNAADAIDGEGEVWIRTRTLRWHEAQPGTHFPPLTGPGPYVAIEVQDTGAGVPEHLIDQIVVPRFTTKETGHGLGLAATLGILQSHGGHLSVASPPGEGATFRALLPLPEVPMARGRVVVGEEDAAQRNRICRMLASAGLPAVGVTSARGVLACLADPGAEPLGLVLHEGLPGLEQPELRLERACAGLPVLLLSDGPTIAPGWARLVDVVSRPIQPLEFFESVDRVFGLSQLR